MKPQQDHRPPNDLVVAFDRLIDDLFGPASPRSKFEPWEIEILLDIDSCNLPVSSKRETLLRKYQKAARRRMQSGRPLIKLSEYMGSVKAQPQGRKPAVRESEVRIPARSS
jgi:hypothetical protein